MAKKSKRAAEREQHRSAADYYKLNVQAVDDLVTADETNSPPVPKAELRKYHAAPKRRIPDWLKAFLLKGWFAGVVCYFIIWGLGMFLPDTLDLLLVTGVVLGFVKDLLENSLVRFYADQEGANDRWMMFPGKKLYFLPLDVVYAILLTACTIMTYNGINLLAAGGSEQAGAAIGVEPILFGIFVTAWDLLFLGCKRLGGRILADAKQINEDRKKAEEAELIEESAES